MNIACIGVGNVGRSWAIRFASMDHQVVLWDHDQAALGRARDAIKTSLDGMLDAGISINLERVLSKISSAETLAAAVANADYVQESVAESVEVKKKVFAQLDEHAPEQTILASSTSAIQASDFLTEVKGRHRCLIVHPVNPPHVIPLVELCGSPYTAHDTIVRAKAIMLELGQSPITVNKEIEGFVLNRLQWALLGEAMHLVGEGYCSAEDIDTVLTDGLALRWSFIGPFSVGHLNASAGLEGYFEVLGDSIKSVQASLKTDYMASEGTISSVHEGLAKQFPVKELVQHQQIRDRRIMLLKQFLQTEEFTKASD